MPHFFNDLSRSERWRVIRQINLKIEALRAVESKLLDRLMSAANLSSNERILINLRLAQISLATDDLINLKRSFRDGSRGIRPPDMETIRQMKAKVEQIAQLNAATTRARTLVRAATGIAGALPTAGTIDDGTT